MSARTVEGPVRSGPTAPTRPSPASSPPVTATAPAGAPAVAVHDRSAAASRVVATLTLAFAADPVIRWLFPDTQDHLLAFPTLLRLVGADALAGAGSTDVVAEGLGAALWVSPGTEIDADPVVALLQRAVAPARHEAVVGFLEQVQEHHPDEPHWYLPFIGVDPRAQGHGHGGQLLRLGASRCDADGLPAYLEASSPRNRALYERHGFEAVAEIRSADSPPLWPMVRPAAADVRPEVDA
jgi:ribosomal protein S18 acetylase RimI-like enzyme